MIEIDRVAIEKTGPALLQMMENAGRNLAEMAIQILGKQWREAVIVVLAEAAATAVAVSAQQGIWPTGMWMSGCVWQIRIA